MKHSVNRPTLLVLGALAIVLGAATSGPGALRAQEGGAPVTTLDPATQCLALHERIAATGIRVEAVQYDFARCRYEVVLASGCTQQDIQEAERLRCEFVGQPLTTTIQDLDEALVVLRFEPTNPFALAVVAANRTELEGRYAAIRAGQ